MFFFNFGQSIVKYRKAAGMTQAELAERLGVNRATISKYENDAISPTWGQLIKIAQILGVPAESLITGNEKSGEQGESMTDEEKALKVFLNSLGYDITKDKDVYFFIYNYGGARIEQDDIKEMLRCTKSGLKTAAKSLELRLIEETFQAISGMAKNTGEAPGTPSEKDTTQGN